jgi:hypothetical protein
MEWSIPLEKGCSSVFRPDKERERDSQVPAIAVAEPLYMSKTTVG